MAKSSPNSNAKDVVWSSDLMSTTGISRSAGISSKSPYWNRK
jgi:hypothetical protein